MPTPKTTLPAVLAALALAVPATASALDAGVATKIKRADRALDAADTALDRGKNRSAIRQLATTRRQIRAAAARVNSGNADASAEALAALAEDVTNVANANDDASTSVDKALDATEATAENAAEQAAELAGGDYPGSGDDSADSSDEDGCKDKGQRSAGGNYPTSTQDTSTQPTAATTRRR